jgi:hypothetical protein
MYKAAARWLIALLVVVTTGTLHAQVAYQNFTANSGLPSNEVYCAFQDKEGYMWFGTDHGIAKYNGYEFTTYTTTDGLTDNTVFQIQQDDKGRLWFLTLNGGICYYDSTGFKPHPMNDSITAICRGQMPTSWHIGSDFKLWLGNIDEGFYKIDISKIRKYGISPRPKRGTPYVWLVNLKDGSFIYSMFVLSTFSEFSDEDVESVVPYKLDWKYITFSRNNFQLLKLSNKMLLIGIVQRAAVFDSSGIKSEYQFNGDSRLIQLKKLLNGEIWMTGTNSPAYRLKNSFPKIELADSLTEFTAMSDVQCNKEGLYFFTSISKGIYTVPQIKIRAYTYTTLLQKNKLNYLKTNASKLFIPYRGLNMVVIDSSMNGYDLRTYQEAGSISGITFNDKNAPISNQDYLFRLDTSTPYPEFYFAKVLHIAGDTFLAGGTGGFGLFKGNQMYYSSRKYGFANRITDLANKGNDSYIIATINGLYYFDTKSGKSTIRPDTLLTNVRITGCTAYNEKLYAIATRGNGVYVYYNNNPFIVNEALGLANNLTESAIFQNDSTLWVASYSGISRISIKRNGEALSFSVKSYDIEDGLCSNQVNMIEVFNNKLWLATNEGLCYFDPAILKKTADTLPLYITSVDINGESYTNELSKLSFSQNNVTINYNALYYNDRAKVRYKVRLKGKEEWRYTYDNLVQYFSLPPGEYEFEVAAEDKYGRYVSQIKKVSFTIIPHYTNTVHFKIFIGLVVIGIAILIVYLLFAYQRFKAQNVIKLLQSEFKALNYQINPHFIFNVLNSIQYYILRKDSDKAVHFLSSFSTLIRRIVSNSRQQYISVIEEVECLKDYLDLEKLRLENKFDYELNIDSNVDIEQKTMLPMIIQPLVENSIWHGIVPLEERGKIKVDFKLDEVGALVCTVDDNGVGINSTKLITKKEQNNLSLAMSNVKERLKIIGELNGSEWFINFKDKSELGNKERGTIVTIRFPLAK